MPNLFLAAAEPRFLDIVGIDLGTILFTLVNTIIMVLLYRHFLHKPVMAMLEKRKEIVSEELKAAESAKISMQEKEREYLALLADSKAEAEKIVSAANARALEKERDIITEANKNAALINQKAEESIALERKRAMNEIKNQISELVIMTAAAVAEKEISEKDNGALIDSFLVNVN
ncbi:MAG: F0F1 ATP synthase subunit B [Oscillospiraceae bacterium]|nr:F0F1 ATP synthase subunit B [Oscillospiraceae bacterium]